ncbi:hypothetical protein V8B97DRAFT_436854 [Scleroderma yunnanense]
MTNNHSTRRSKKPWKTKSVQSTMDPQFTLSQNSSPSLTPNISTTSCGSSDITQGKLTRLKNLLSFNRSNQNVASPAIGGNTSVQAELQESLPKEGLTEVIPAHEV